MIQQTFWKNGILVRRSYPVIGESGIGYGLMATLLGTVLVLAMTGCGSVGPQGEEGPEGPQGEQGDAGQRGDDGAPGEQTVVVLQKGDAGTTEREIPLCMWEDPPVAGECQRLVYGSPGFPGYCNRWVPCN